MKYSFPDKQLYFGEVEPASAAGATAFPDTINLGKSDASMLRAVCIARPGAQAMTEFEITASDGTNSKTYKADFQKDGTAEIAFTDEIRDYPILTAKVKGQGSFFAGIDTYTGL